MAAPHVLVMQTMQKKGTWRHGEAHLLESSHLDMQQERHKSVCQHAAYILKPCPRSSVRKLKGLGSVTPRLCLFFALEAVG